MSDLLTILAQSYLETNAKNKNRKVGNSTSKKSDSYYFGRVNSKYESMLSSHRDFYGIPDIKTKTHIVEKCISFVEQDGGLSKKAYLARLRDTMTEFALNLAFLMECRDLKLDPFVTAQNMVVNYRHRAALKDGIAITFKGKFDLLEEPLFTESELADAKFSDVEGYATNAQKTQLSTLIGRAMKILPESEDQPQVDTTIKVK